LSERLLSAIQRGAAALCIRNAMIDATFKDGEDALMLDAHGDKIGAQSFHPMRGSSSFSAHSRQSTRPRLKMRAAISASFVWHHT
jgi:hypothetical protein